MVTELVGTNHKSWALTVDRNIPAGVRRALRTEVGFVCPIPFCASPYLTYHHFDPPFHLGPHHDPAGMIALCLQHHKQADIGTYRIEQLRALKANVNRNIVAGKFEWRRETTLFVAGGLYFIDVAVVLQANGRNLVWLSKAEDGSDLINLDLHAAGGELVYLMRDNEWLVTPGLDDIEAPPAGRSLSIRSERHDVMFDMEFREFDVSALRQLVYVLQTEGGMAEKRAADFADSITSRVATISAGRAVLVCQVYGRLRWPISANLRPGFFEHTSGRGTMRGIFMSGTRVGLGISEGSGIGVTLGSL